MPSLLACNQVRLHIELQCRMDPQTFGNYQECYWASKRELLSNHPERTRHVPSGEYRTETRETLAIEVVIASNESIEQHMRNYAQGKLGTYSEVWYFALSDLFPSLNKTREKLQKSGVNVSKIHLFSADTILIPPVLPKRMKKKGS